jgi:hypothetical protein
MAPIDEWLKVWLSATDLAREGEYRSPGPLQVYAMKMRGDGPQFSGPLPAWESFAEQLATSQVTLGLVAMETEVEYAYFKYPGVTLAFESPFGGTAVAREVMTKLGQLGVGGILAETDRGGRFGVLRILMTPRWYAQSDDRLFGLDWSKVPNDPVHCDEAKKTWAMGVHAALRTALADIPAMCVDTVRFGAFDIVDWLHDLGPRESTLLYGAKPRQLSDALGKLGSYDLDALSSVHPRPFVEKGPFLTLYDELEYEVNMDWLKAELASPDSLLLHVRGHASGVTSELLFVLLRRRPDGRIRLTVVKFYPNDVGVRDDVFEVNPACLTWPKGGRKPLKEADAILLAYINRYGDVHDAGTLHARPPIISESGHRKALMTWFRKSETSAEDYELVKDLRRRVHMVMSVIFNEVVDQRELTDEEAQELHGWLTEEGQQRIELEWLVYHWNKAYRPSGLPADQIEEWFS